MEWIECDAKQENQQQSWLRMLNSKCFAYGRSFEFAKAFGMWMLMYLTGINAPYCLWLFVTKSFEQWWWCGIFHSFQLRCPFQERIKSLIEHSDKKIALRFKVRATMQFCFWDRSIVFAYFCWCQMKKQWFGSTSNYSNVTTKFIASSILFWA